MEILLRVLSEVSNRPSFTPLTHGHHQCEWRATANAPNLLGSQAKTRSFCHSFKAPKVAPENLAFAALLVLSIGWFTWTRESPNPWLPPPIQPSPLDHLPPPPLLSSPSPDIPAPVPDPPTTVIADPIWPERAASVKEAFLHGYNGYEQFTTFPDDELQPISGSGIRKWVHISGSGFHIDGLSVLI